MKLHTGACQFPDNPDLVNVLVDTFKERPRIRVIIETGTYLGLGSTQLLIRAIKQFEKENPRAFSIDLYTIEIDEGNYLKAQNNLKDYPFVHCLHGCSIDAEKAREFIKNDKMLLEHEKYPDIFIDSLDDPTGFYLDEIRGKRFNYGYGERNNILMKLMPQVFKKRPLFLLDSAGGLGYLEFQTVVENMGNHRYYILLDDVSHVKHNRSAAYIKQCKWPILYENERCLFACHPGVVGRTRK